MLDNICLKIYFDVDFVQMKGLLLTVYLLLYDMTLWAVMWCDPKVIGQDLFCEENGIKMKQKLTFALLIYEQKKKTAVKKKGCDLWFAM